MKKLTLVALAALLAASMAYAGWWQTYGGQGSDAGNCVQVTSDEDFILAGQKSDSLWVFKVDTSGKTLFSKAYYDYSFGLHWLEETSDGYIVTRGKSLLKLNADGDSVWQRDYGVYTYCVQPTSDNGYILTGGSNGVGYDPQLVLIKTDAQGNPIWTKTYGDPARNRNTGYFLRRTKDNGYIITGLTGIESEEYASTSLWLVKTNSEGDTLWTREFGDWNNQEWNSGNCVQETSDNGFIITGDRNSGNSLWLIKTDKDGFVVWEKLYSSVSGGEGNSVQQTIDNGYIVTGTTDAVYLSASSPASRKLWLLKTNTQGDTSWTRVYGGDGYENGKSVQQTSDLGYIVAGYTSSFGAGGSDVYLLKTDSLGLLDVAEKPIPESLNWGMVFSLGSSIVLHYADCPSGLQISVFDVCGRNIDAINVTGQSGTLTLGEDYPSGVYFTQITNNNQTRTARVVLVH